MRQPKLQLPLSNRFLHFVHSVRFRLSVWYVAILTLVLLVFGITIYSVEAYNLSMAVDTELSTIGEQLSKTVVSNGGVLKFPTQISSTLQQLSLLQLSKQDLGKIENFPGVKSFLQGDYIMLLISPQGQVTQQFGSLTQNDADHLKEAAAQTAGKNEGVSSSYQLTIEAGNGANKSYKDYRIYTLPVRDGTKVIGTMVLGLAWEGAETLRNLLLVLLLAGLVTMVVTAAGGYWLASRAMRPVSNITRTVREIGETDLSRRLNISNRDEIGELATTFDAMLSRLEDAFQRQRQFSADASHELRTPLTIVNLEVNRTLGRRRSFEEYERAFSIIQVENDYMTRLVNNLLLLARTDAKQITLNVVQLDLSDLTLEVVERLAPLAQQNNIELATGELPELEISGDRLYLTRMLANLVENGIKHTAGVGNRLQVETGLSKAAANNPDCPENTKWAWVRVTDNGPGIPTECQPHLFDRFYQVDKARTYNEQVDGKEEAKGSGLGLSIVQAVVQAHQGTVTVASEAGKGSSFEVRLPIK